MVLDANEKQQMKQSFAEGRWADYIRFYTKYLIGEPLEGRAIEPNQPRNDLDVYFVRTPSKITMYYNQDGYRNLKRVRDKCFIQSVYNLN